MLSAILRKPVSRVVDPVAVFLLRIGITPNGMTFFGSLGTSAMALWLWPQGEYFWDTDPGQGNAIPLLATDGNFDAVLEHLMKNNIDVANLIKAFGKRRLEFSTQDLELGAHLSNDLDSSEIAKVNSILASKNITYRF